MSQRNTSPLKRSTVRRTLQRFWDVTRTQPLIVFLSVFSSAGYIFLLTFANTYVMALIVDRVQAGPVAGDQVFEVFGSYILALVLVNLVGQILSKLQDYTVYKLEIAGNYHLARLCFDTLSNQSMTFHTSRFGGSLVSQTSRFMSGYTGLVDVTVYSLIPTITSVICTVAALAPVVPTFTVILACIMTVYIAFVWLMYKRIMPLSAATSAAQNKLSGVLSDAVTNILAVKTCGREDFERDLFDAADRAARDAETVSMHAMMQRNFTTSGLIVITMAVVSVFVAGGNAWFGISAGSLVMIFTYTYNLTMRLNYVSSMMQRINRALGDAAEMTRVLDEPRLVADDPDAPELKVTEGAIDFEHLSFAYRDAAAGESVFDNLTLHVAAGQRVGLVGKSGSGKTTLVLETLIPALKAQAAGERLPGHVRWVDAEGIARANLIDATPIGANVRSTVATYADIHDELRRAFARTPEAKAAGYKAGAFSYNTGALRCPTCDGTGSISLDVQFLPDVEIVCPACRGSRYAEAASHIHREGRDGSLLTLPQLMDMSVDEAIDATLGLKKVQTRLQTLHDLGLGYLTLGEPTPALSGGEAQRLKLASEMGRVQDDAVFVFDEPTIGLHPLDVQVLLSVFDGLVAKGATVIVIEHDLDLIRNADYVIDMGPGGGDAGGQIVCAGTPGDIAACSKSITGRYL